MAVRTTRRWSSRSAKGKRRAVRQPGSSAGHILHIVSKNPRNRAIACIVTAEWMKGLVASRNTLSILVAACVFTGGACGVFGEGDKTITLTIRGTVTSEADGIPIEGAQVEIEWLGGVPSPATVVEASTTTDAQGRFFIQEDAGPNCYEWAFHFFVSADSFRTEHLTVGQGNFDMVCDLWTEERYVGCTNDTQTLDFQLQKLDFWPC